MCTSWKVFVCSRELLLLGIVLAMMDRLFHLINLKHHDGPPLKSSMLISATIVFAFRHICMVETPQLSGLCLFTQSSRMFSRSGHLLLFPLNTLFCLFTVTKFFLLPPTSHHKLVDAKLIRSGFVSFFCGQIIAFNLKAAS